MNKHFDILVIGGGIAGVCCSLAAARHGLKVALVESQEYLGGNASPMLEVCPEGAMAMGRNRFSDETGIVDEIRSLWYRHKRPSCALLSETLWELVSKERNIELHIYTKAIEAVAEDNIIKAVTLRHLQTHEETVLTAFLIADCSGDGDIAAGVGAEYMLGREGRESFSETLAPPVADDGIMGATIKFTTRKLPWKIDFTPPEEAYRFADDRAFPYRRHQDVRGLIWWLEYAAANDVFDQEKLYREHLKILFGFWDHMKNRGDHGCDNYLIDFISPYVARRESRRFKGDYILTQNDLENGGKFTDGVAFGGWPVDLHPPRGIFSHEPPAVQSFTDIYNIPFRSLYSGNIGNLLFAGRNISVSHVALGSTRVEWTCGVMGQAIGTAAALCVSEKLLPGEIYPKHMEKLQQMLLKDDCFIIGEKNKDPDDHARTAKISAGSSAPLAITSPEGMEELKNRKICQTFPMSGNKLDSIALYLENRSDEKNEALLKVFKCGGDLRELFSTAELLGEKRVVLAGKFSGWVNFDSASELTEAVPCWWLLESGGEIAVGYSQGDVPGCTRGVFDTDKDKFVVNTGYHDDEQALWHQEIRTYCFKTFPLQFVFGPENVNNGIARPYIEPNLWISDPSSKFPQYLELEFPGEIAIKEIHLTFNPGLNRTWPHDFAIGECVKDYTLAAKDKDWVEILNVKDNFLRKRVHEVDVKTKFLRLIVNETHGAAGAQVFELRVY